MSKRPSFVIMGVPQGASEHPRTAEHLDGSEGCVTLRLCLTPPLSHTGPSLGDLPLVKILGAHKPPKSKSDFVTPWGDDNEGKFAF